MNKAQLKWSALSVLFFSFITHGYRFFNNMYSHDALLMVYQGDFAWQIALGRFLQPLLLFFRGSLCNPWLISFCAVFWIFLSVYFLAELLNIHHPAGITLISGILICNMTTIVANASYLPWVDFYALSCFCAIFGIWCLKKGCAASRAQGWWYAFGVFFLVFSMGIYQSYICVAIGLAMIDILADLRQRETFRNTLKKVLCYVFSLLATALLYYLAWKILQNVLHIWTADGYNGLAEVGDYSDTSLFAVLANTYRQVFQYFWNPDTFKSLVYRNYSFMNIWQIILRFVNLMIFASVLVQIIRANIRQKSLWWQNLLQAVILLLFPFGINFVSFISKGMEQPLMIFAFSLVYLLALQLCASLPAPVTAPASGIDASSDTASVKGASEDSTNRYTFSDSLRRAMPALFVVIPLGLLLWSNVVYANQVYLKKELQAEATQAMLSRIVVSIESTENYVAGETPVAFSGNFQTSDYLQELADFEEIAPYGMGKSTATYVGTDYALLKYLLNVNMNLTRINTGEEEVKKQLDEMPCYPAQGSIRYIGETLVVKIAD